MENGQNDKARPTADRRDRRRARRIDEIMRAGAEILAERGYAKTSLDEVAERIDLVKSSLYNYFSSKEELFSACLETVAEEGMQRLQKVASEQGSPTERLRKLLIEQQIITTEAYPELSQLFLRHFDWPPSIAQKIIEWEHRHDLIFKRVIDEGIRTGELHAADPRVARRCIHGALNFVPLWYRTGETSAGHKELEVVADALLLLFGVDGHKSGRTRSRPSMKPCPP